MDDLPDEVAETEDQDGHTSEFDYIGKIRIEILDVVAKHRSQRKRSETLCEGDTGRSSNCEALPKRRPVQRVVRIC